MTVIRGCCETQCMNIEKYLTMHCLSWQSEVGKTCQYNVCVVIICIKRLKTENMCRSIVWTSEISEVVMCFLLPMSQTVFCICSLLSTQKKTWLLNSIYFSRQTLLFKSFSCLTWLCEMYFYFAVHTHCCVVTWIITVTVIFDELIVYDHWRL